MRIFSFNGILERNLWCDLRSCDCAANLILYILKNGYARSGLVEYVLLWASKGWIRRLGAWELFLHYFCISLSLSLGTTWIVQFLERCNVWFYKLFLGSVIRNAGRSLFHSLRCMWIWHLCSFWKSINFFIRSPANLKFSLMLTSTKSVSWLEN